MEPQQLELHPPSSGAGGDEGVDPVGERLRIGALVLGRQPDRRLGDAGESVDPLPAIEGQRDRSHQLGELPSGHAPGELHLEQPLPSLEIALHAQRVAEGAGPHGGDASGIEADLDPGAEAGDARRTPVGQLAANVDHRHRHRREEQRPEEHRHPSDPAPHRPPSPAARSSWSRP